MSESEEKKPVIGFTLDHETKDTYSKMPWFAIRENYCKSVSRFGAVPICLPHEQNAIDAYLDMIDGLLITGGAFDIPPILYGVSDKHETVVEKKDRTVFEWGMVVGAIQRKMPILGICGGEQLLAVVLGGKLIQHIPDAVENCIPHEQENPRNEAGHSVRFVHDTLLRQIAGQDDADVNSAHHQAIESVPDGVIINSHAPDGVIEGIELPTEEHPFCLGVQWHPEYFVDPVDTKIMDAFVWASREYSNIPVL